jgi:bifunctional non-homologous end joining protein LigD
MVFQAFDCLHLNGLDLRGAALLDRKRLLEDLMPTQPAPLRLSEHTTEGGAILLRHACRMGLEGIVSKRGDQPYRSGRSRDWVKSKCAGREEFVVGGFMPSTAARRAVGSLVLGQYQDGRLVYAGKAGSGLSESLAVSLFKTLDAERRQASPFDPPPPSDAARGVRYVDPRLVVEVEYRGRTAAGLIRHAVFKGVRDDKLAAEVMREELPLAAEPEPPAPSVRLTHPDRLLWPDAGVTKQGLADFYAEIWKWIRPHVTGRPLALVRCPEGIAGECFFQKHQWAGLGPHVLRVADPEDAQPILAIDELDGLIALVQAGVLEIHPWGSLVSDLERPDRVTIDLDPGEGVDWSTLCDAARDVRDRLAADGLVSFCKTTGGKGLHVVVPLRPKAGWEEVKAYTKGLADRMEKDDPARYVASATKARWGGRIFVDYLRNARGATAVGAYSTRARPGATVSTPVAWDELGPGLVPGRFTVNNLVGRLDSLSADPWAGMGDVDQVLPGRGVRR